MKVNELPKNKEEIVVKKYLPTITKNAVCDNIVASCLKVNKDGYLAYDPFQKRIATEMAIIVNYTDIEFGEEFINDYDFLCENEIFDYIVGKILPNELEYYYYIVDNMIEQKMQEANSIEATFIKAISKLPSEKDITKLTKTILKDLPKMINKIDKENMEIIGGIIKK